MAKVLWSLGLSLVLGLRNETNLGNETLAVDTQATRNETLANSTNTSIEIPVPVGNMFPETEQACCFEEKQYWCGDSTVGSEDDAKCGEAQGTWKAGACLGVRGGKKIQCCVTPTPAAPKCQGMQCTAPSARYQGLPQGTKMPTTDSAKRLERAEKKVAKNQGQLSPAGNSSLIKLRVTALQSLTAPNATTATAANATVTKKANATAANNSSVSFIQLRATAVNETAPNATAPNATAPDANATAPDADANATAANNSSVPPQTNATNHPAVNVSNITAPNLETTAEMTDVCLSKVLDATKLECDNIKIDYTYFNKYQNCDAYGRMRTPGPGMGDEIDTIVIHEGGHPSTLLPLWADSSSSTHLQVDEDGTVYQMMPINYVAHHSACVNERSIGIDVSARRWKYNPCAPCEQRNLGSINDTNVAGGAEEARYCKYSQETYKSLGDLVTCLVTSYPDIKADWQHIVGHREISNLQFAKTCEPHMAEDPKKFKWDQLQVDGAVMANTRKKTRGGWGMTYGPIGPKDLKPGAPKKGEVVPDPLAVRVDDIDEEDRKIMREAGFSADLIDLGHNPRVKLAQKRNSRKKLSIKVQQVEESTYN